MAWGRMLWTACCLSSRSSAFHFVRWVNMSWKYWLKVACHAWPSPSSLVTFAAFSRSTSPARNSAKMWKDWWNCCNYSVMYRKVCGVWLQYCATRQKSVISCTHRMVILLLVWEAAGRQGASFVCRRVAVKHAKMTWVTPLISVLFHIVICRYHFVGC